MQAQALFSELAAQWIGVSGEREISRIVSDTREVCADCAFVCIAGGRFDSHTCAREVIDRGAALVVCDRALDADIPQVRVADTREALSLLWSAYYGHPQRSFRHIVGITGTNGKTSTSLMLRRILEDAGCSCGVVGTTQYIVGQNAYDAPLTTPDPADLFRLFAEMREAKNDTLLMEVSSHSMAQKRVCGIPFELCIFTNLTQDHLDYHGTMEAYGSEKKKLFSLCKTGLFNADDPACEDFVQSASCEIYRYGTDAKAAFGAADIALFSDHVAYTLTRQEIKQPVKVPVPGLFSVYNSLAAASAALLYGVDPRSIAASLAAMEAVPGRMERVENDRGITVLIDFAHTPNALENVLKTINGFKRGKLYTLFGCGGDRDRQKRPLMGEIACRYSDAVTVTSDNSRTEEKADIIAQILEGCRDTNTPVRVIEDRTEAIIQTLNSAGAGDVVLLAGKGHEAYEIDKTGKHPYSEKDIVRRFFDEKQEG